MIVCAHKKHASKYTALAHGRGIYAAPEKKAAWWKWKVWAAIHGSRAAKHEGMGWIFRERVSSMIHIFGNRVEYVYVDSDGMYEFHPCVQ